MTYHVDKPAVAATVIGGTPKEPLLESVWGLAGNHSISPGDEVLTFVNSHSAYMELGIYRGLIRKGTKEKYTTHYIIERANGKRSIMFYRNFVRLDISIKDLAEKRF